jgi:hypothetical protein
VGEVLVIANTSSITGAANANSGQYIVTSASAGGLTATKYIDTDGVTLTPPVAVAPGAAVVAGTLDAYTVLTFTHAAASVNGLAKSLSFFRSAGPGVHFVSGTTPLTTSIFATSAQEKVQSIAVQRQADNLSETFRVGGNVVLTIGYAATIATPVVVGATTITLNGTPLLKASYATLGDLVAYINAQTNWTAAVPAAFKALPLSVLDYGTFDARNNGYTGSMPARIKKDAYDTAKAISTSRGVEFVVAPTSGIPVTQAAFFLAGGAKGGTTDAAVLAALAAAGRTRWTTSSTATPTRPRPTPSTASTPPWWRTSSSSRSSRSAGRGRPSCRSRPPTRRPRPPRRRWPPTARSSTSST